MEVKKILSYTIPLYGNRRIFPYGRMRVEHEGKEYVVRFGNTDDQGRFYITAARRRFYFRNAGSLHAPCFEFYNPDEVRRIKRTASRREDLLNTLVDHMVEDAGNQNRPVIEKLAEYGFTEDELILTLGFPPEEVKSVMLSLNGGGQYAV